MTMIKFSDEALRKAEFVMMNEYLDTPRKKLEAAINEALAQHEREQAEERNKRLKEKIEELEGIS